MKVLSPAITCIVGSHMKPYLRDALNSILAQTRLDVQVIVADSGRWLGEEDSTSQAMAQVYYDFHNHPLIEWVTTGEGRELKRERCPIGWVTNEVIRAGLIRGRYVCTFYDDDVYYPTFFERMAAYLDVHDECVGVWCSQDRIRLLPDGSQVKIGWIGATAAKRGPVFDCQVDGAQVMFRREALDAIGDPWLPEDPGDSCRHSDGIFLDKLGGVGLVGNIEDTLLAHRFTPISTYTPS